MNAVTYQIKAALSTSLPLTGEGEERILDVVTGELIARFWNGNLVLSSHSLATDAAQGSVATVVLNSEAA